MAARRRSNDGDSDYVSGHSLMSRGKAALAPYMPRPVARSWRRITRTLNAALPKGLFFRSLLIIVVPILILQMVLTLVFLDRHWELTTQRLSAAVVREMAAIIELLHTIPMGPDRYEILKVAANKMQMDVRLLSGDQLEADTSNIGGVDLLTTSLSNEITTNIGSPYSITYSVNANDDTFVEVRILVGGETVAFTFPRNNAYASNWHIFLVWMASTSLVLILIAVAFLRNQIRPIERLAAAMERFGKGQPTDRFHAAGAREVRRAAQAFLDMRRRIERQVEQRTTMLAGVSHDLRTILTRFRLELAFFGDDPDAEAMRHDADDMEAMLEAYLAFARDDADEASTRTAIEPLLADAVASARRSGAEITFSYDGEAQMSLRPAGFRRMIDNLLANAARFGAHIAVAGAHRDGFLTVTIDDDGPGIPKESREDVFRPFFRLDSARNQDQRGTGLGLAIVRDVARAHGGDVTMADSPLGGCRAIVRIPG